MEKEYKYLKKSEKQHQIEHGLLVEEREARRLEAEAEARILQKKREEEEIYKMAKSLEQERERKRPLEVGICRYFFQFDYSGIYVFSRHLTRRRNGSNRL